MKAAAVFTVFLILFTSAALAIPAPMFPGNMVPVWLNIPQSLYVPYISAIVNGIVYSLSAWAVFVLISKRLEKAHEE